MTRRIKPGDKSLTADHLNKQSAMSDDLLSGRRGSGANRYGVSSLSSGHHQPTDPDVLLVRNDTGCTIEKFGAIGLDGIVEAHDEPVYSAGIPNSCRHVGQFAVAIEPIEPNSYGRVVFSGHVVSLLPENAKGTVDLHVEDPAFSVGESHFNEVSDGAANVLWSVPKQNSTGAWIGGIRIRNAGFNAVHSERDSCGCASHACEYECTQNGSEYEWAVAKRGCPPKSRAVAGITSREEHCDCPSTDNVSSDRFPCDASSLGNRMTMSCENANATTYTATITGLDDNAELCDTSCTWKKGEGYNAWVMVEGCQEACGQACRCIHPSLLDISPSADLVRMPCVENSDQGICVFMSLGNRWEHVYDNCNSECPCSEPQDPASMFPAGHKVTKSCADIRCTPCYPPGFCRWEHTIVTETVGLFTRHRSSWSMIASNCPTYCECETNPPHSYSGTFSSYFAPYSDGEIVDVPCCRSPITGCSTSTSTTTPPPTSTTTSTTTDSPPTSTTTPPSTTTTTASPTTGCPTLNPDTTPTVKYYEKFPDPVTGEKNQIDGPDCQLFCFRKCPRLASRFIDGNYQCVVFDETYEAVWIGMEGGGSYATTMCYPYTPSVAICELQYECNASTVGLIPGKCRHWYDSDDPPVINWPDFSGKPSTCQR